MLDINDYLLRYQRKIPKILLIWLTLLSFIIAVLIIINHCFKFNSYYQVQGIVKDNLLSVYVLVDDLKNITGNNTVYIENDKYKYKVASMKEEIISNNTLFYKEVLLHIDLKDKNFIDNNIIKVKFIVKEMTSFEYIIDLIRG